ncbi:MAG: MmcQ/YjbR family DNA-binding protein [Bacteroidetes bacterium]|nr:MmcQ/YjbR family DNA-binding protein [Bacteroidota bacterium]
MNIEDIREYCISKKGVTEEFPFDDVTLVFKVMGKMFLLIGLNHVPLFFNAKCDPERALELRERYPAIIAGFHMSKKHWNTVEIDGSLPDGLERELIDHSYDLVVSGLTRKLKTELESL